MKTNEYGRNEWTNWVKLNNALFFLELTFEKDSLGEILHWGANWRCRCFGLFRLQGWILGRRCLLRWSGLGGAENHQPYQTQQIDQKRHDAENREETGPFKTRPLLRSCKNRKWAKFNHCMKGWMSLVWKFSQIDKEYSNMIAKVLILPRSEGRHQRCWGLWRKMLGSVGVGMVTPSRSS